MLFNFISGFGEKLAAAVPLQTGGLPLLTKLKRTKTHNDFYIHSGTNQLINFYIKHFICNDQGD